MQIAGTIQGSTQVRPQQSNNGGNGNGGGHPGTRRVFVPSGKPPQQQTSQSNPQYMQSRRTQMSDQNQGSVTQVIPAVITQEDVGKQVRVAVSDVQGEVMGQQTAPQPDPMAEMRAQIEAMRRENAALKQQNAALSDLRRGPGLTLKVSPQGALSIYGLRRFPATYYAQEWQKILADETVAAIKDFIKQNSLKRDGGVLDDNPKDANGNPIAHLTYQYRDNTKK